MPRPKRYRKFRPVVLAAYCYQRADSENDAEFLERRRHLAETIVRWAVGAPKARVLVTLPGSPDWAGAPNLDLAWARWRCVTEAAIALDRSERSYNTLFQACKRWVADRGASRWDAIVLWPQRLEPAAWDDEGRLAA